eukprot:6183840-Pleurochrysis_carterae.AAC.1
MRKTVRPPTARTRCKLIQVKMPLPRECFAELMKPALDGDAQGLLRGENGLMLPTNRDKKSRTLNRFQYVITRPMVTDRIFNLALADLGASPQPRGEEGAWRRGHGCARLQLSANAAKQGRLAQVISMVAGVLHI